MSIRKFYCLLVLSLWVPGPMALAQPYDGVSGRWEGSFDIPAKDGSFQHDTAYFILRDDAGAVSGSVGRNEAMQTAISQGLFRDGHLAFAVEIRPGTVVKFDLRLENEHLAGTATGVPPDPEAKVAVDVTRVPAPDVTSLLRSFTGSIYVRRGGQALADRSFGLANVEWGEPNTSATKFRIGSLTKQFTAAGILLLEERGKLHLGDRISMYIDDLPPTWNNITILELLTHTSGIESLTDLPPDKSRVWQGGRPSEILARIRDLPLRFQPGTQARYSNSGYILLGMIIERASGVSYESFLRTAIFEPLEMHDTGVDSNSLILPSRSSGYRLNGTRLVPADYIDMSVPFAAGDLYSTTHDLGRWAEALFGGRILGPQSLSKMLATYKGDFGLGVVITKEDGFRLISHTGAIQGFTSELRYYPEQHLSVIVLSNSEDQAATMQLSRLLSQRALSGALASVLPADTLREEIESADQTLFSAYNACDITAFDRLLDSHLQFFHDTVGLTDHQWNVEALSKRCKESTKYRRVLEQDTLRVFPVPGFGAIEFGRHQFYATDGTAPSTLVASPEFINVWRKTSDGWKVAVALSVGHR
jgi:CubicO group peptidase (beta-lactamase class C family)